MKTVCATLVATFLLGHSAVAEQEFTATQQAMWGLQWAESLTQSCSKNVQWIETTAGQMNVRLGHKVLRSEGHKNGALAKARRTPGAGPYVQFDAWLKDEGFQTNSKNARQFQCEYAKKIAGTNHPIGRFLVRK
ncbi:MAG: hypothetical protein ABJQ34_16375 [Paracoccaceae bacterium]